MLFCSKKRKRKCGQAYPISRAFPPGFLLTFSHRDSSIISKQGRLSENLLFVELIRRNFKLGLDLFYYRTNNDKEVDFLCRKGHQIVQLVQVCFDLSDPRTFKREMSALATAAKELFCNDLLILTWDQEFSREENGYSVSIRPVWKWSLD